MTCRNREPFLEILQGRPGVLMLMEVFSFSFQRTNSSCLSIRSYLAVTTSLVEPLPHQITAVIVNVSRQPLRFLLADDPGAETIMTGLFIKELLIERV